MSFVTYQVVVRFEVSMLKPRSELEETFNLSPLKDKIRQVLEKEPGMLATHPTLSFTMEAA